MYDTPSSLRHFAEPHCRRFAFRQIDFIFSSPACALRPPLNYVISLRWTYQYEPPRYESHYCSTFIFSQNISLFLCCISEYRHCQASLSFLWISPATPYFSFPMPFHDYRAPLLSRFSFGIPTLNTAVSPILLRHFIESEEYRPPPRHVSRRMSSSAIEYLRRLQTDEPFSFRRVTHSHHISWLVSLSAFSSYLLIADCRARIYLRCFTSLLFSYRYYHSLFLISHCLRFIFLPISSFHWGHIIHTILYWNFSAIRHTRPLFRLLLSLLTQTYISVASYWGFITPRHTFYHVVDIHATVFTEYQILLSSYLLSYACRAPGIFIILDMNTASISYHVGFTRRTFVSILNTASCHRGHLLLNVRALLQDVIISSLRALLTASEFSLGACSSCLSVIALREVTPTSSNLSLSSYHHQRQITETVFSHFGRDDWSLHFSLHHASGMWRLE